MEEDGTISGKILSENLTNPKIHHQDPFPVRTSLAQTRTGHWAAVATTPQDNKLVEAEKTT